MVTGRDVQEVSLEKKAGYSRMSSCVRFFQHHPELNSVLTLSPGDPTVRVQS